VNRRPLFAAALVAVVLLPGLALASPAPAVSEAAAVTVSTSGSGGVAAEFAANALALGAAFVPGAGQRYDAVSYRPRSGGRRYDRGPWVSSPVQFHLGGFDPEGDAGQMFVTGFRAGPQIDPHVQVGMGLDWMHKREDQSIVLSESDGPGGTTISTRQQLSESSSDLFPIMAFIQVNADDDLPVIPYAGLAGGYQVLFLSATDYATNQDYNATFGGWAWQAWAGLALPLSGQMRLTGEVFVNNGEASRDTDGPLGITYHETVGLDGGGGRVGLSWGF
jgi:hypothetical protein